jgi:hypothetical protein
MSAPSGAESISRALPDPDQVGDRFHVVGDETRRRWVYIGPSVTLMSDDGRNEFLHVAPWMLEPVPVESRPEAAEHCAADGDPLTLADAEPAPQPPEQR